MYTVQCTIYITYNVCRMVYYTVYTVHRILVIRIRYSRYIVHCTLNIIQCTLHMWLYSAYPKMWALCLLYSTQRASPVTPTTCTHTYSIYIEPSGRRYRKFYALRNKLRYGRNKTRRRRRRGDLVTKMKLYVNIRQTTLRPLIQFTSRPCV